MLEMADVYKSMAKRVFGASPESGAGLLPGRSENCQEAYDTNARTRTHSSRHICPPFNKSFRLVVEPFSLPFVL